MARRHYLRPYLRLYHITRPARATNQCARATRTRTRAGTWAPEEARGARRHQPPLATGAAPKTKCHRTTMAPTMATHKS